MYTGGLSSPFLMHDSLMQHRPMGAAWPANPALPAYEGGLPPMVARQVHKYDAPPPHSGTGLDQGGWTPSSWATMSDPAPYALGRGGTRHTYHAEGDSIYRYKRLDHKPIDPLHATAENDWGLNPYDANTPFLREFHRWAEEQDVLMKREGIEMYARADRMPGLSTLMARTAPLVPRLELYPEAPPSMRARTVTDTIDSVWATKATTEAMRRGYPAPLKSAAPCMTHGFTGRRSTAGRYNSHERADWKHPSDRTVVPSQVFH
jgi:hypothetical protein